MEKKKNLVVSVMVLALFVGFTSWLTNLYIEKKIGFKRCSSR